MSAQLSILVIASCAVALARLAMAQHERSPLSRYAARWAVKYSLLFIDRNPRRDASAHLALCGIWIALAYDAGSLALLLLLPMVALAPFFLLDRRIGHRRLRLSEGLASWLSVLSNTLESSPNVGEGLGRSAALVPSPLREELLLLCQECRYGLPLEQAIQRSVRRLDSPLYTSTMTTLLIGQQSGGDLSRLLKRSAGALREMERLEGLVRAKTAAGKSQTFVLAVMPFAVVAAMQKLDPSFLPGLFAHPAGRSAALIAVLLWGAGLLLTRKIVQVEM